MIGDGQCDERCYTAECEWDGLDCGCAPKCRYENLSVCKEECLVIDCAYGLLNGYASCTDTRTLMSRKFASLFTLRNLRIIPINESVVCSPELWSLSFFNCNKYLRCLKDFEMCDPPTETCERAIFGGCVQCIAGLVNSAGVCQAQCAPGLRPHPIVPDFCVPENSTSPASPMVFYIDSDYEGSERDGSRAQPFNTLHEGLAHSSYKYVKLLLKGSLLTLGEVGSVTYPSSNYIWGKEATSVESLLSISTLECEESHNCGRLQVLVYGQLSLPNCIPRNQKRHLEFKNIAFEAHPSAFPNSAKSFLNVGDGSLKLINVSFTSFRKPAFLVYFTVNLFVSLSNVDFLDIAPSSAIFGAEVAYENNKCSDFLTPSNFTYESGSIVFSSPLSTPLVFLRHTYMHSVLISKVTLSGVAGQVGFTLIEADSWVSLELRDSLFERNEMGSGYFVHVESTKWSAAETIIDVFGAISKININISNCVFRNNHFTTGTELAFRYQKFIQNVVLQNLTFEEEIGTLISIASSVSALRRTKRPAFSHPITHAKLIGPPALVSLRNLTILRCSSSTAGLIRVSQLPYTEISGLTVQGGAEELPMCVPVLWADSLYSLHLSGSTFMGKNCAQSSSEVQVSNSLSIVTIQQCTFTSNPTSSSSAISITSPALVVLTEVRVQNFTSLLNGVIAVYGLSTGSIQLTNVVLEGNKGMGRIGGALYLSNLAEISISDCSFLHNSAINGGAIGVYANLPVPTRLSITACVFEGNQASGQGGAVHISFDSPAALLFLSLRHSAVARNVALAGSGLYLAPRIQLLAASALTNLTIASNMAETHGVLSLNYQSGNLPLSSVSFSGNTGQQGESCLYLSTVTGSITIYNATFKGNFGLYAVRSAYCVEFTMSNVLFQHNSGISLCLESTKFSCYECNFALNVGSGLVLLSGSTVYLLSAVFQSNTVSGSESTVQLSDLASLTCTDCVFFNNTARTKGSTLQSEGNSQITLNSSRFEGNTVAGQGSALTLISVKSVFVRNCSFTRNHAEQGGTLFLTSSTITLQNSSLSHNTASVRSAGLLINQSNVTLTDCELANQGEAIGYFMIITTLSVVYLERVTMREGHNTDIGAIYIAESSLSLSHCQVWGLTGNKGTLIYAFEFANITLDHTSVTQSHSSNNELVYLLLSSGYFSFSSFSNYSGSAITAQESSLTVSSSSFTQASSGIGTGLKCVQCVFLSLSNSLFEDLAASKGAAVVIEGRVSSSDVVKVDNTMFRANVGTTAGALYVLNAIVEIERSQFIGNAANETAGGGIVFLCSDVQANCFLSVGSSTFTQNFAALRGGAISWENVQPRFEQLSFLSNVALYGPDYSSFPTHLSTFNTSLTQVASGQAYPGSLVFYLRDHYEQVVADDNTTKAVLYISGFNAKIAGKTDATARSGIFTFAGFNISATPGTKPRLTAAVQGLNKTLDLYVFMRECRLGESRIEDECIPCEAGKHWVGPAQPCADCPPEAECLGGDRVFPRPGYWRYSMSSSVFWTCPNSESCLGLNSITGECAEGYEGNMCQTCSLNYHRSGKLFCEKCPSFASSIATSIGFIISVLASNLFIVITSIKSAQKDKALQSVYLKLFMNYLQLVMLMGSFNLSWPTLTKQLLDIQDSGGGFSERLFNTDCLTDNFDENEAFFTKVALISSVPLIFFSISSLCWIIAAIIKHSWSFLNKQLIASGIILFFLVHPSVMRVMFSVFSCEEIQPGEQWVTGLQVRCWEGRHLTYALAVALPALIIWGVGVPAVILGGLVVQRKRLRYGAVQIRFGYLFKGYVDSKFYWEFIIIYRKLLIIVIATFLSRAAKMTQALLVLSALVLFLVLHYHSRPFSHASLNIMEHRSLLVSIATIFFGLFYLDGSLQAAAEYLCFALILLFNIYFLQYWLAQVIAVSFVLLVKRFLWFQQRFVVINNTTAVSYATFHRKTRSEVQFKVKSSGLPIYSKHNYLKRLHEQNTD